MLKFNKIVLLILYILDAIKMKIKYKKIKGIISIGKNRKGYVYCEEIKSEVVINKRNLNKVMSEQHHKYILPKFDDNTLQYMNDISN